MIRNRVLVWTLPELSRRSPPFDRGHPISLISGAPTTTLELALEHSR